MTPSQADIRAVLKTWRPLHDLNLTRVAVQVKTVLPPANFTRAIHGSFSGLPHAESGSSGGAEAPDAVARGGGPAAGGPASAHLHGAACEEVVLATASSLRLVALPLLQTSAAGAPEQPEAMALDNSEDAAALYDAESAACRTLCEQPVYGTITCLRALTRHSYTVRLLCFHFARAKRLPQLWSCSLACGSTNELGPLRIKRCLRTKPSIARALRRTTMLRAA